MKVLITEKQRKSVNEMIKLDIKVGDTLMGGKFKNKKVVVKTIGKNDKGDITINGKPLLRFRILKEDDSENRIVKIFKQWLYSNYDNIAFLENKTYDGLPLIVVYHTVESNAANYDTWLAMDIMDSWNKLTSDTIPVMVRWSNRISSDTKILIDVEEYDEDDDMINEDIHKSRIIKRYWDKLSSQGKEPSIGNTTLSLFHVEYNDLPDLQDFLVEYLGGYEVAIKKTIKMLENLPPIDLDTGDIQSKWKYVQVKSVFSSSIGIDVVVFGENVQDTVEDMDMPEYFDFSDYINDQVGSDLYEFVTTKTGIDIYVGSIDYSNE